MKYLLVLLGIAFSSQLAYSQSKIVGCYWDPDSVHGQVFNNLCSHGFYKSFEVQPDGNILPKGNPPIAMQQKFLNPGTTIIASIEMSSSNYGIVSFDPTATSNFIKNCVDLAVNNGFDGIDIDLKNAGNNDGGYFVNMLRELKAALNAQGKILTAVITEAAPAKYDTPGICQNVDLLSFEASQITNDTNVLTLNSPYAFFSSKIDHLITVSGCQADKLLLGVSPKGYMFAITYDDTFDFKYDPGTPATFFSDSVMSYSETCSFMQGLDLTTHRVDTTLYSTDSIIGWYTNEDPESVAVKVNFVKEKGLAGMAFYAADQDDYDNTCGYGNSPLISTAFNGLVLGKTLDVTSKPDPTESSSTPMQNVEIPETTTIAIDPMVPPSEPQPPISVPCTENEVLADPSDCTQYQRCTNGVLVTQTCEGLLSWRQKTRACIPLMTNPDCFSADLLPFILDILGYDP